MRKTFLLLSVLALAACDKPTASVQLECNLNKDWQNPVSWLRTDEDQKDIVPVRMDAKIYQNHAVLVVNGKESTLHKISEDRSVGEFGPVHVTYHGVFPDTDHIADFSFTGKIASKNIMHFSISFDKERLVSDGTSYHLSRSCKPIKEEYKGGYGQANVPWRHGYKMPNKIEKCITTITDTVYCHDSQCNGLYISVPNFHHSLTAEAAVKISPNWDYSNMRLYQNDGKLEEYEMDACEVVDRLFKYIDELGLKDAQTIENAMDKCGEECRAVVADGDQGDFLIRLPESEALLKIANKTKNAKFLSVFNPNSYAKAGYCLLNIIPYNTMEKLGWKNKGCQYRLYCGAPEFMDYDQYYAVEVCY